VLFERVPNTHAAAIHRSFFNPEKMETDIEERLEE
jgi:hypothetical protein